MTTEIPTGLVASISALGGASATAVAVFFLKDFFATTKKDLRALTNAVTELVHELKSLDRDIRKLEGVVEVQQKELRTATKAFDKLDANMKAVWSTLHNKGLAERRLSDGPKV